MPAASATPAPTSPRLFVSHSHLDNGLGVRLVADLRARLGEDAVWYDASGGLHGGEEWWNTIVAEITARDTFLVILSPDALASDWVPREMGIAYWQHVKLGKRLIPLNYRPCHLSTDWELIHALPMRDPQTEPAAYTLDLDGLLAALGILDAASAYPTPPSPSVSSSQPTRPEWQERLVRRLTQEVHTAFGREQWRQVLLRSQALLDEAPDAMSAGLWRERGLAALSLVQASDAQAAFEQALAADPTDIATLRAAAQAEELVGQPSQAERLLKKAQVYAPLDNTETQAALLGDLRAVQERQQHWNEALQTLEEELGLVPSTAGGTTDLLVARARLFEEGGRAPEALAQWRTLTGQPQATVDWWLARARLAKTVANDPDEVRAALEAARRLAPQSDAVAEAEHDLLPPAFAPMAPSQLPQPLASLGFTGVRGMVNGKQLEWLIPPICDVPAGPFHMGDDKHSVTLPRYQIATYPVTVAEYACFVRAGHDEPGDWHKQLPQLDHPVVSVSWNDATAYAAWLSERTGHPWRLPSEEEWEKAARGPDGRVYPWGDQFDKTRCNTAESGIKGTTPIGKYPSGASPYGAQDMAGNVWEWTASRYGNSTENRVLRGGSWGNGARLARAACRYVSRPGFVSNFNGFRLVVGASAGS